MKLFFTFFFTTLIFSFSFSQEHTIRGFLYDIKNGEPVIFEKVFILQLDSSIVSGANTDVNGFFSIPELAKGSYILKIDNGEFKKIYSKLEVSKADGFTNVKFELETKEKISELQDVVISADSKKKKNEVLILKIKINKKTI